MRIAPLDINGPFKSRYSNNKSPKFYNKREVRIDFQEIPDDVVIRYEKWPDGFFYPQTAGQFRIQQKNLDDAFMVLAREQVTV